MPQRVDSRLPATNWNGHVQFMGGVPIYMNICYWCKRPKGDEDGQPEYFDYEFCLTCKNQVDKGIVIIQTTETSNGNPTIKTDLYPTGKWVVVTEDRIREVLKDWVGLQDVLKTGQMFMNEKTWKKFKLPN